MHMPDGYVGFHRRTGYWFCWTKAPHFYKSPLPSAIDRWHEHALLINQILIFIYTFLFVLICILIPQCPINVMKKNYSQYNDKCTNNDCSNEKVNFGLIASWKNRYCFDFILPAKCWYEFEAKISHLKFRMEGLNPMSDSFRSVLPLLKLLFLKQFPVGM